MSFRDAGFAGIEQLKRGLHRIAYITPGAGIKLVAALERFVDYFFQIFV